MSKYGVARALREGPDGDDDDRYFNLQQAAAHTGLSVRTLQRYMTDPAHPLPYWRVGRRVLISRRVLRRWLQTFATLALTVGAEMLPGWPLFGPFFLPS